MMLRRSLLALVALAPLSLAAPALAGESVPYTPEAFAAAQKAGKPILVEVSAPWCPICKTQKPILSKLSADPRFKELQIFDIDFDSQKDALRTFNARMQSTLIAFKGATETGRSVGETQPEWIEGLVEKAL
ncbi:thioredoxin family protein [Methylobacterium sp. BTF04]|uniref:thioredoxin family protein n=1 Tax=Methylobacterium sp. BTF04 TaxID=2708300 RepID=UPI0013D24B41|nr:thioredoxin family protein [Methylobacterium sp. BTF04]NEU12800.1 thioredoxin family protein [Methylobacterium sp. BTF04]